MTTVQSTPHTSLCSAPLSDPEPTQELWSKIKQTLCSLQSEARSISKREEREKGKRVETSQGNVCCWTRVGQTCGGLLCVCECVSETWSCAASIVNMCVHTDVAGESICRELCTYVFAACVCVCVWKGVYAILNTCVSVQCVRRTSVCFFCLICREFGAFCTRLNLSSEAVRFLRFYYWLVVETPP